MQDKDEITLKLVALKIEYISLLIEKEKNMLEELKQRERLIQSKIDDNREDLRHLKQLKDILEGKTNKIEDVGVRCLNSLSDVFDFSNFTIRIEEKPTDWGGRDAIFTKRT